jgi:uncharacterized protein (TIGR00288 family)
MEDKRFAVLIDSDNISAKYISYILAEMTKYGDITYKRIYGDWTSTQTTKWKDQLLENSITPIQQFSNTVGKNATDSALIIDAMDILYTKNVEGFCIVSSDSDFTRLASRLRESGVDVIGMGEEKTPRSFRAACTVFTNLEILIDQDEEPLNDVEVVTGRSTVNLKQTDDRAKTADVENVKELDNHGIVSKKTIENDIVSIITENENNERSTGLGEIGSRLVKKYSDFDVRNYGYSSLSKFLEETDTLELIKKNRTITVKIKDNRIEKARLDEYAIELVKASKKSGLELAVLGSKMHNEFIDFKVRAYGYATFAKFVQSISELEIRENKSKKKMVYLVNK